MPRKRYQHGNITIDGNFWRLRYWQDVRMPDGTIKKTRPSIILGPATGPQKLSRKQAQKLADEFLSPINASAWVPQNLISVEQFITRHFDPDVVWTMKEAGKAHYGYMFKLVMPLVGKRQLRELTVPDIQNVIRSLMARGYSPQTLIHAKNVLSAVVKHAKTLGMFSGDNPASLVRLPSKNSKPKPALTWDQAQQALMITPEPYRTMALMSMTTSMNIAELLGLRWGRVNLTTKPVYLAADDLWLPAMSLAVIENFYRGKYGSVKTTSRNRIQPISPDLADALRDMSPAAGANDTPVFSSRNGTPVDAHNANKRVWKKVGKVIGVPGLSWHSFRRTAATLTDQIGMSKADRIAMMGHSDSAMTDHYTESDIERRRQYLDTLAARLKSESSSLNTTSTPAEWIQKTTGIT